MSFSFEEQVLMNVRLLLSDPDNWTQGYRCLTKRGESVDPWSRYGVRYCVVGAIEGVVSRLLRRPYATPESVKLWEYLNDVVKLLDDPACRRYRVGTLMVANDSFIPKKAHSLVLEILDLAIELLPRTTDRKNP